MDSASDSTIDNDSIGRVKATADNLHNHDSSTEKPSNKIIAPITVNLLPVLASTDSLPTISARGITKFSDLPLEILTMIAGHLVDDYLETRYKMPEPLYEQMKFDFRTRDRTFFDARRVNQSMRQACLIAFFQRTAPLFKNRSNALKDFCMYGEEKFSREIDGAQARIYAKEEKIAVLLDEEVPDRTLRYTVIRRDILRLRNQTLAAERVSDRLKVVSWEYLLTVHHNEIMKGDLGSCSDSCQACSCAAAYALKNGHR